MAQGCLWVESSQKHYWEDSSRKGNRGSVVSALKDSLCRLGLSSVDVYQLHWPGVRGNEGYIDCLGDAVEQGLVKAVGVSNYNGVPTGEYTPENPPSGPRGQIYTPEFLIRKNSLFIEGPNLLRTGSSLQVVLNWLIAQENVVPIPGTKNSEQAKEFAGALGWRFTDEEIAELWYLASETKPVIGLPVENL
ncbi:uncharacterized oxidoreductase At1g06690, chloroplastic-like [Macadamia integrifolia]|uniref:uncharacterized oxidoreductase At1g06690, chloroplastic-like n=1 Tax=Macadamia integrifolia TaxID=60698 RepID=UPI001C4F3480|nr:uncharacterized oxidoreductase At1g06690, chloroplastic-like [Macadamia integrifolia]